MFFPQVILLIAALWAAPLRACRVNWTHYPKVNPWTFEEDEVRYPNHANLHPDEIQNLIDADNELLAAPQRMILTAIKIQKQSWAPEKKAVVMRDCLNAIASKHRNWVALDAQYANSVGFVGAVISDERFLLLLSLKDGKFYRGEVHCRDFMAEGWQPDLENRGRWRPVQER